MKYAMVIIESDEELEPRSEAERDFDALAQWWADLKTRGKITASARLVSTQPVISVSWRGSQPIVTDGPYLEAKESVAGFALLDVESESEARDIVASWPARVGDRVELRRVVER